MKIIDASVAVKWFIEEESSESAVNVLNEIQNHPENFFVPDFFFIEILSVLSRINKNEKAVKQYLTDLEDLGLSRISASHEVIQKACFYAIKYELSAYDSVYISCAELVGGLWLTVDKKTHKKIMKLGLSELIL